MTVWKFSGSDVNRDVIVSIGTSTPPKDWHNMFSFKKSPPKVFVCILYEARNSQSLEKSYGKQ